MDDPEETETSERDDAQRSVAFSEHADRLLIREVLALTPAERLETLRTVDAFFAGARRVD